MEHLMIEIVVTGYPRVLACSRYRTREEAVDGAAEVADRLDSSLTLEELRREIDENGEAPVRDGQASVAVIATPQAP